MYKAEMRLEYIKLLEVRAKKVVTAAFFTMLFGTGKYVT
jgi:hypothetical protein